MMAGVNKVILVGNLGQDPDVRFMPNGNTVANIRIATSESWKDQQGQRQERTEWHSVVLFRKLGEVAGQYLKKGTKVYIEGKLQTRKWQDQNGNDRYTTEIVADQMQMLDSRQSNNGQGYSQQPSGNQGQQRPPASNNQQAIPHPVDQNGRPITHNTGGPGGAYNSQSVPPASNPDDGWDDDIPFDQLRGKLLLCM